MKKILDIAPPKLLTVPSLAHFDAICKGQNDPNVEDWILQNCLSLCYQKRESIHESYMHIVTLFPMNICEYLNVYNIQHELYLDDTNLFMKMINNGFYQIATVDKFYINAYWEAGQRYHTTHPILIYGYDNNHFLFTDFFYRNTTMPTYLFKTATKIELDEAMRGYINIEKREDAKDDYLVGVQCVKPTTPKTSVNDTERIIYMARSFLNSEIPYELLSFNGLRNMELSFIYGINSFDELINAIQNAQPDHMHSIIRMVQTLFVHSLVVKDCINKFSTDLSLIALSNQYFNDVTIVRNKYLKMFITGEHNYTFLEKAVANLKLKVRKVFANMTDICKFI